MANIKTMEEYTEEANKTTQKQRDKALKAQEDSANAKINQTNDEYNKAIADAKVAYEDEYQRNAVQKLINERTIAERNANLGLTDSGLNRTQLTANQMSYANQKGKIDLTRQNAITTLEGNLASAIATIKQENEANKLVINQNYDQYNTELATQMYNADIATAQIEAQEQAAAEAAAAKPRNYQTVDNSVNLLTYSGIDEKTGKSVFYDKNGKKRLVERGVNPYTGTKNSDAKYGTFNNGYQPDNIGLYTNENGKKGINTLSRTGIITTLNGKDINVWQDKTGKKWFWDGVNNCYLEYFDN